jgi:hypothetical protein
VAGDLAGEHRVSDRVAALRTHAQDARPVPVLAVAAGLVEVCCRATLASPVGRARFVKSQKLKTEYALFGQFFGMPGKGADEIRLAVVNQEGKVVLTDRLDRQQLLSRGATKIDPMLACSYAVDQLRAFWGLSNPTELLQSLKWRWKNRVVWV